MKRNSAHLFVFTLCAITFTPTLYAYVHAVDDERIVRLQEEYEEVKTGAVKVPVFEGGFSFNLGPTFLTPSSDFQTADVEVDDAGNTSTVNFDTDYQVGFDGNIGYVMPDTANAIELYYRVISADATHSDGASIDDELNALDLMVSQFIDIGHHMQMRFLGGISYANIIHRNQVEESKSNVKNDSDYNGGGLRVGMDGRYDWGYGFGIVGGGSAAYYLGELDVKTTDAEGLTHEDNHSNHGVFNFRINLGIDYAFSWDYEDEDAVLGFELGYLMDYYNEAIGFVEEENTAETSAVTWSGPYFNIKSIF